MNIAQAMKQKNRLVKKLSQLRSNIQMENSQRDDIDEREFDVEAAMVEQDKLMNELIRLKITIFVASVPVREHILRMSELKTKIVFLSQMNTKNGPVSEFGGEAVSYTAMFNKTWVRESIAECEAEIDRLQDELDAFNHKTEVEMSQGESDEQKETV